MVNPLPLLRASALSPFVNFLEIVGTPTEKLLQRANLSVYALDDPHALLPRHQAFCFLEAAARREGIDNLGWLVGKRSSIQKLGAFGRLVTEAITLHDAIARAIQLIGLFNSGERFWLGAQGDRAWLGQEFFNLDGLDPHHASHFSLTLMLELIQQVAGSHWYPQEIYLQTCHLGRPDNHPLARAQIDTTQGITAIVFPRSFLNLPLQCAVTSNGHQDYTFLQTSAPALHFVGSLQQAIAPLLGESYPSVQVAAEISQMSVRTLQRRLAEEGLSYSRLVEQTRFKRATVWLQDPTLKLMEIAAELGYRDAAHFTRAFKRWTGMSPREFRAQNLQVSP